MVFAPVFRRFFWPLLVFVASGAAIWALSWGAPVPFSDLFSPDAAKSEIARRIFLELRPPRVFAAFFVGASLSVAGAALQTMFRNPLAEPYLLGISAGGALGATLAAALSLGTFALGTVVFEIGALWAFCGALGAAATVYALGKSGARRDFLPDFSGGAALDSHAKLLLVGVALSAFLAALMSLVVTLSGKIELSQRVAFWLLGGFGRASWPQNAVLLASFVAGISLLLLNSRDLNALRAGDRDARLLGVETRVLHGRVLLATSILCASSVAVAGLIGFVGLLAPHTVRLLLKKLEMNASIQTLLPASALCGAALLVLCDGLARAAFAPIEVPVGIFTALLGVPLFLSVARRF